MAAISAMRFSPTEPGDSGVSESLPGPEPRNDARDHGLWPGNPLGWHHVSCEKSLRNEIESQSRPHELLGSGCTISDQDEGELGIVAAGSPVTLIQIQDLLAAKELCAHRVWQREVFKHLQDL